MKTITILMLTIILNACGGAKEASVEAVAETPTPKTEAIKESPKMLQEETVVFEYSAVSRGAFKQVIANKELISIQTSRGQKPETKPCSPELWNKLMSALNTVDLEDISKYEAPSKAHQVDGALAATLKVTHEAKTYLSQTFDHGKPNKQLHSLVEVLVTMGIK